MIKAIVVGFLLVAASIVSAADIPKEIITTAVANVFHVYTESKGSGSGFYIGDDKFITACHVLDGNKVATLVDKDKKHILTADVLSCNDENDIAILSIKDDPYNSNAFANKPPKLIGQYPELGQTIYGSGYALGFQLLHVDGHWQDLIYNTPVGKIAIISVPVIYGDSGSPVFPYIDGELVYIGIRLQLMTWPIDQDSGNVEHEGEDAPPVDYGFVSQISIIGLSETILEELELLEK